MNFAAALDKAKKLKRKQSSLDQKDKKIKSSAESSSITTKTISSKNDNNKPIVNFIIIGVQKAGTSAAVVNLTKHEDIWLKPGQVHYFDRWYGKGLNYYRDLMRPKKSNIKLIGEKTPTYIYCDGCLDRIKKSCPNAKFLLFLREPVSRAYSHWNMLKYNMKQEDLTFDEAINRELKEFLTQEKNYGNALYHYVQRGYYMDQINNFLKYFPKEQLLVVIAERIKKNPKKEHDRIFNFLGVSSMPIEAEEVHKGNYRDELPDKTKTKLKKIYHEHNERLFEWLGERITEWE